jgi:hypothetical protein
VKALFYWVFCNSSAVFGLDFKVNFWSFSAPDSLEEVLGVPAMVFGISRGQEFYGAAPRGPDLLCFLQF